MPYIKNNTDGLTTMPQAAKQVGMNYRQFWGWVKFQNRIPAPKTQVGLRRYYDKDELNRVLVAVAKLREEGVL